MSSNRAPDNYTGGSITVIRSIEQAHPAVVHGRVDVVVLGNWTKWAMNGEPIRHHVRHNGHTLKEPFGRAEICTLPWQAARQ
jgi:hypothetical protein